MAAPAPSKGSMAAKKGVDTKRRLKEATAQAHAVAVSANVAKDAAMDDAAEALMRDLKQDPVLLFTVKGCHDNGTLATLLMGAGPTTPAPTKRSILRDSVRKWKDIPQFIFAEFIHMVSPAVKEAWQNSEWGEMDYIGILCHALHIAPETVIDFKNYPTMKNIPVLLRCMSMRHESMGSRIAAGVPGDMRYWQLDVAEKELVLKVCGSEARFRLWLPSCEDCTLTDENIMEKSKLHAPRFGIDVTCLQLVLSGDYEAQREPVLQHLIAESAPWSLPSHVLEVEGSEPACAADAASAAPSAGGVSVLSKRKSLSDIESRLKSKARSSMAAGSSRVVSVPSTWQEWGIWPERTSSGLLAVSAFVLLECTQVAKVVIAVSATELQFCMYMGNRHSVCFCSALVSLLGTALGWV
eukprot:2248126-Amphidinium_carterae.2